MKRVGLIGGGLVALLAIIIGVLPYLVPSEVYRAQIEKQAEAALGRDVSLEGDARLSILPRIAARVEGVKVANPEGFSGANMIEAGELRARVKLLPLFARRVEIAEISLVDANVSLERLADGTANWEFVSSAEDAPVSSEEAPGFEAGIDRARLINSSLTYRNAAASANYSLKEFNARASMRSMEKPLSFEGTGVLNGQNFDLSLDLDNIAAIAAGETVDTEFNLKTELGSVAYDGKITIGEVPELLGAFDMSSNQFSSIADLLGMDLGIDLAALGNLQAKGSVSGTIDALKLEIDRARQSSEFFSASFSGFMDLGSDAPLDGTFSLKANDAVRAADALKLNLPIQLSPIGSIDIAGTVKGSFTSPQFSFDRFRQDSNLMNTDYSGLIIFQEDPTLNGSLQLDVEDAGRVLTLLGMDAGPVDALEALNFSGDIKGSLSNLNITGSSLSHKGALLNLDYKGDISTGSDGNISGPLSASSNDLRGLLDALGVELAPGETLRSFEMDGTLSGTPDNLNMTSLKLKIDDVQGAGLAGLDMRGTTPKLVADIRLPKLDLSPVLGEDPDNASPQSTGWSTTPLALDGLRAVNADITLKSDLLTIGKVELTQTDVSAKLTGGDLQADITGLNAFGGKWVGDLQLDASRNTPRLSIDMRGADVSIKSVLSTLANLESVSGTGGMSFKASSSGNTLDALVRGLNGELTTDLANGAVKGFNLAQIVRSRGDILAALTSGSIDFVLSPEAETDFTEFSSALTITNGVANIDILRALNPAVLLDGDGRIDLVNQSIDISITPSVDTSGVGELSMLKLNGEPFALPFRVYGSWLAPSVAIDNAAISQQLRTRATSEIGGRIADELGGDLGGLVGDALGTPKRKSAPQDEQKEADKSKETPPSNLDDPKDPESLDDAVEDLAKDALKDLFGRGN